MTFVEKKKNVKMPGPGMKATAGMGNLLGVCVYIIQMLWNYFYFYNKKTCEYWAAELTISNNIRWISNQNLNQNKLSYNLLLSYFYKVKLR